MATPPIRQQSADGIETLKGLEVIRRRPGMYMGVGPDGIYQMLYEVLYNSVHEAMAHHCDSIEISLNADRSITIFDNSRGISVDTYAWEDLTFLEVKLSILICGSRPLDDYMYYVSGGIHGVGLLAVNALSEWLIAEIRRDGFLWRQSYARGVRTSDVIKVRPLADGETTGTSITFLPDSEIFSIFNDFTYDYEVLAARCRQIAYLLHSVTIRLMDRRVATSPRETTFHVEGGLETFVTDLNRDRQPLHSPVVGIKAIPIDTAKPDENIVEIEFTFQYTDDSHTSELMFVNTLETQGGTHLTGLRTALTRTLNQWMRKTSAGDLKFAGQDTRKGLTAVVSLRHPNPWFESQTSVKLMNKEVRGMVASVISRAFVEYLEKHPDQAQCIVDHLRRAGDNK